MDMSKLQEKSVACEVCEEPMASPIISGLELKNFAQIPIRMCKSCGPIDLDVMQYCREIVTGCNDN